MDGQYPPPIPGLGAFYPTGPAPMFSPEVFPPRLHQLQTLSMENFGGYTDYDDPSQVMQLPQGQQRQRRRQPPGSEHVKHRRTRSGCYTCRQRRVKCDETRPTCDRCRKGKRECQYPGTPTTSSSKPSRSETRSSGSLPDSGSSPSGDELFADEKGELPSIPDDQEDDGTDEHHEPLSSTTENRSPLDNTFLPKGEAASPTMEEPSSALHGPTRPEATQTSSNHPAKASISQGSRWQQLPKDVRAYLKYHRDSLSHHHYAFKYDAGNFLKSTFLKIALHDDSQALLYAVVAFAAYHHALRSDDARISIFLSYYNKSIMLLQESLLKKRRSVATLLTILQLATIEEFLGDWVNLLGHQRAAHQILMDLFTPETIMQDETRRRIISWYIRFDIFAGILSGGETALGREWFAACAEHYSKQARERPNDLRARFEDFFSTSRLLATDVALLFAARSKNSFSDDTFVNDANVVMERFANFGSKLETAFTDPTCFVKAFPKAPSPQPDDIVDYRDPNFLYADEFFTMNFICIDFWGIDLMFKYQVLIAQRQQPSHKLTEIALKICKMFEAVEHYDQGPPGAVLGCHASLGIASLFLPKDERHTNWCRRKYALIEQNGYIYPATLRKRMTEQWNIDVTHWWLPNDEGYPQIIRDIREFIEYRADKTPTDPLGADLRDMSGIFRTLNVSDDQSIPDDLKGSTIDSDQFDVIMDPSMTWESSPEQHWS